MNTYPRWKYLILIFSLILGLVYALPNLYGDDPAIQISNLKEAEISPETSAAIEASLKESNFSYKSMENENNSLLIRFFNTETQLKAKDILKKQLGDTYSVALNLAPATPNWFQFLGAKPMKLGLDLRGGVHFLMDIDVDSVIARRIETFYLEVPKLLREEKLHYKKIDRVSGSTFQVVFDNPEERNKALEFLQQNSQEFSLKAEEKDNQPIISIEMSEVALREIRNDTVDQTLLTLRNRVNELGVAEALVQRHGAHQVVLELPGIQDTAYARNILGKTATLKFYLMDEENDIQDVLQGQPKAGSKIFYDRSNRPILVKNQVILTGDSITHATTGQDQDGRPTVNVRLGGDVGTFSRATKENVGRHIVTVYVELKDHKTEETVINVATITSALGNHFQISGMKAQEARDLSLLLRAGALPAAVSIVEERIVGPSMGQENIEKGLLSMAIGLGLVLIFMALYYSVFGWIANLALVANLILLIALMSLIGATLTLPGIAGIVLTLGMAVDANVLIFERIREELRQGMSPQASIHRGFEYAFATILDSNLTTLIVAVILFGVGTGPIKGLAVTLSLGILTSLFTGTMGSRALVNLFYGGRSVKRLRLGV